MKLTKQNLLIFFLILCFIGHGLSREAFANDIRSGVDSDTALRITIDCIQAASGIVVNKKDGDNSGKGARSRVALLFSKISPEDTLKQAGITDDYRLNALKNYIVRNREFGVPSLWGQNRELVPYQVQNYIIPFSALKKINLDTPVSEVAAAIKTNAGLPFLPIKKAISIVSCCRCLTKDCKEENKCEKNAKNIASEKDNKKIPTSLPIVEDSEVNPDFLLACIYSNPQKGLGSALIEDATGETYRYRISDSTLGAYKQAISKWNYKTLIENLAYDAYVPPTRDFVPTRIVIDTITAMTGKHTPNKSSFTLAELFQSLFSKKLNGSESKYKFSKSDSLKSLPVEYDEMIKKLIEISGQIDKYSYVYKVENQGKNQQRIQEKFIVKFSEEELKEMSREKTSGDLSEKTLGELIEIIDGLLKKKEEANKKREAAKKEAVQ